MNTYLIPVTEPFGYKYNYIACVYADTPREAYLKAKQIPDIELNSQMVNEDPSTYEVYKINIPVEKQLFHVSEIDAILPLKDTRGENMAFFNVNWNNYTDQLSSIAMEESWSNDTYPNNGILANYIVKTYNKLQAEKMLSIRRIMLCLTPDSSLNTMNLYMHISQDMTYLSLPDMNSAA